MKYHFILPCGMESKYYETLFFLKIRNFFEFITSIHLAWIKVIAGDCFTTFAMTFGISYE
jgi:hypothetical protein